jgi:hypothetical protein
MCAATQVLVRRSARIRNAERQSSQGRRRGREKLNRDVLSIGDARVQSRSFDKYGKLASASRR